MDTGLASEAGIRHTGLTHVDERVMSARSSDTLGVSLEVLGHLDRLRDGLSSMVKARAACLRAGVQDEVTEAEDIKRAWDDLLVRKACDLSACAILGKVRPVTPKSVDVVCMLKRAVAEKALDRALTRSREANREATVRDIEEAWDVLTYGSRPDLAADVLLATVTPDTPGSPAGPTELDR